MRSHILSAFLVLALTACASAPSQPVLSVQTISLIETTHGIAEQLAREASGSLDPGQPLLVAELVSVNDPQRSSPFGRIVAEQMAGRLVQLGQGVYEWRGDPAVSGDARRMAASQGAQAVLAGTYAASWSRLYLSLKLIRVADGRLLAAADRSLPLDDNLLSMLGEEYGEWMQARFTRARTAY